MDIDNNQVISEETKPKKSTKKSVKDTSNNGEVKKEDNTEVLLNSNEKVKEKKIRKCSICKSLDHDIRKCPDKKA